MRRKHENKPAPRLKDIAWLFINKVAYLIGRFIKKYLPVLIKVVGWLLT